LFDLFIFPIHLSGGKEIADLPGLVVSAAPRRVLRNRAGDTLAALLTLPSKNILTAESQQEMLLHLSATYFNTPGSVTSGLRAASEQINTFILGSNQFDSPSGRPNVGVLNLVVFHGDTLYILHSGPTHTLVVNPDGVTDYVDLEGAGRGLGVSSTITPRYFTTTIREGSMVMLCPSPPPTWTPALLAGSSRLSLDQFRRRLLAQSPFNMTAAVAQIQSGRGEVHRLKPRIPQEAAPADPYAEPKPDQDAAEPEVAEQPLTEPVYDNIPVPEIPASPDIPLTLPDTSWLSEQPATPREVPAISKPAEHPIPHQAEPPRPAYEKPKDDHIGFRTIPANEIPGPQVATPETPLLDKLTNFLHKLIEIPEQVAPKIKPPKIKINPVKTDPSGSIAASTLLFIALAVPVIVVFISTSVYTQSGRGEQRTEYLVQAQAFALQAAGQIDPDAQRSGWTQSLFYVKKAEEYGRTEDTRMLRDQAQTALDALDSIIRLPVQEAVPDAIPSNISISHIAASTTDVFALDSNQGRILRFALTGDGYELDPNFNCGPGPSGGKMVGALVDLVTLPLNNEYKASVMGMDSGGNLLYCIPGSPPLSSTLAPPATNWGKITAFTVEEGSLIILDQTSNAVWWVAGDGVGFPGQPHLFFDNEIPKLADVIDLAMYQDDLLLLRKDGHVTRCTFNNFSSSPTRCQDPAGFGDKMGKPIAQFPDVQFLQLATVPPPDPSIYIIDANGPTIFHFTLRLNLQRRLRFQTVDQYSLPDRPVTAFDVASNRVAWIAMGNRVFYTPLP
jgi:uncharacterized membrane protein